MLRLTRSQVREVDRLAIEQYHIPGIVLMENAAKALTDAAVNMLSSSGKRVLIVCGSGNNGGDGFAAARMLHERFSVEIAFTDDPLKITGDAATNMARVLQLKLATSPATHAQIRRAKCDLIIDAIFGTGLSSPPRAAAAEIIDAMNTRDIPILAVDLPSGLDCDKGIPLGPSCIRAAKTVTFVAEKAGFANPESKQYTGEVIVGDIGVPKELIDRASKTV
ncbi:MAG TPA: NAD(P)H-hydrate epimerase [Tepidisphaeraceae bacterium]|jgi:NAD(P)H-hydrate epimerase